MTRVPPRGTSDDLGSPGSAGTSPPVATASGPVGGSGAGSAGRPGRARLVGVMVTMGLLAGNLFAFNALLSGWATARLDLTEDRLFSISPATQRLVGSLEDDLFIYGYFSKRTHPKLAPLVPTIRDVLDEYRSLGGGRLHVEIVDPGRNQLAEQEASDRFGIRSTPFRLASKYETGIVNAYFALVVKYGDQYVRYGFDDLIEVEPLPDGDVDVRLRNFEYDLTRAIKKVVYGFRSSAELFERIGEPVRLTAVVTPDRLPEVFKDVPEALRKAAAELEEAGQDRFDFEEIVPEDEAAQREVARLYGARPMTAGLFSDESFYLYGFLAVGQRLEQLVLTGGDVTAATLRETIESSLRRLAPGFLKTVGVVAPDPSLPPELMMQFRMQGQAPPPPPPEFEQLKELLRQDYEVRDVRLDAAGGVPTEVDVLLVLKPKDLDERAVYHLDQYLMRGGRMILAAGSYEADFSPSGLSVRPVRSGLDDWLKHYGIEIGKTLLLDDRNQPLPIPEVRRTVFGNIQTWVMRPYPYLVEVRDEGLKNRAITAKLDAVGIYWGSPIEVHPDEKKKLEVMEILASSERSWTDDDVTRAGTVNYTVPAEGTKPHILAAALQGSFESYFTERPVPAAGGEDGEEKSAEVPLQRSPETRLAVVGDAAFLSDLVARALGRQQGGFFVQNLGFIQNLIDWMNLDNDLIAIRTRAAGVRRLERTERPAEVAIEAVNYVLPVLVLVGLGLSRLWRRRRVVPVVGRRTERARTVAVTAEG